MYIIYRKGAEVPRDVVNSNDGSVTFGVDVEIVDGKIYPLEEVKEGESIIIAKHCWDGIFIEYPIHTIPRKNMRKIKDYKDFIDKLYRYSEKCDVYKKAFKTTN